MISVSCQAFDEPSGMWNPDEVAVEIVVSDTGCGIPTEKLESIFREFEQVESTPPRQHSPGLGEPHGVDLSHNKLIDCRHEKVWDWLLSLASSNNLAVSYEWIQHLEKAVGSPSYFRLSRRAPVAVSYLFHRPIPLALRWFAPTTRLGTTADPADWRSTIS